MDVNDLLAVIGNWGTCGGDGPSWGGGGDDAAAIVQACIDAADAQQLTGEAWANAVIACICAELGIGCGG